MKDPSVAQSIVFVVDDDAAIRESIDPSRRAERENHRFKKTLEAGTYGCIVVDDEHDGFKGLLLHHAANPQAAADLDQSMGPAIHLHTRALGSPA